MSKDTFVKSTPQKGNFHPHETPPVPYQNNFYSPLSAFRKFIVINKNSICRTTDFSPAIYARTVSNSNVTPMRIPCHLMKYCLTEAPRLAPTPFDGAMRQCLQRASRVATCFLQFSVPRSHQWTRPRTSQVDSCRIRVRTPQNGRDGFHDIFFCPSSFISFCGFSGELRQEKVLIRYLLN